MIKVGDFITDGKEAALDCLEAQIKLFHEEFATILDKFHQELVAVRDEVHGTPLAINSVSFYQVMKQMETDWSKFGETLKEAVCQSSVEEIGGLSAKLGQVNQWWKELIILMQNC